MKGISFSTRSIKAFPGKVVTRRLVKKSKRPYYKQGEACFVREGWRVFDIYDKISPRNLPWDVSTFVFG